MESQRMLFLLLIAQALPGLLLFIAGCMVCIERVALLLVCMTMFFVFAKNGYCLRVPVSGCCAASFDLRTVFFDWPVMVFVSRTLIIPGLSTAFAWMLMAIVLVATVIAWMLPVIVCCDFDIVSAARFIVKLMGFFAKQALLIAGLIQFIVKPPFAIATVMKLIASHLFVIVSVVLFIVWLTELAASPLPLIAGLTTPFAKLDFLPAWLWASGLVGLWHFDVLFGVMSYGLWVMGYELRACPPKAG